MMKTLLEQGHLGPDAIDARTEPCMRTPLLICARLGNADGVKLLLHHGADPRKADRFGT